MIHLAQLARGSLQSLLSIRVTLVGIPRHPEGIQGKRPLRTTGLPCECL